MKAQRRHELQQSDLAKVIKQAPNFWQEAGTKYLLGAIAVVVIVVLVRYRISYNRQAATQAMDSLAQARQSIDQMEGLSFQASLMPPGQAAVRRRQYFNDASTFIADATSRSDEKQIAAEALIAKGDLNWAAAQMPELVGAATQPALQFKDPRELTATASDAYQTVLNTYPDIRHAAIAARFGLGAIAENRGEFDEAKKQYEAIAMATNDIAAYQQLASGRLRSLDQLKKPVIMAKPSTEPVEPGPTTLAAVPDLIAAPTTASAKRQAPAMPATQTATTVPSPATKP